MELGRQRDARMRVLSVAIIDGHTMPLLLPFNTVEAVDKSVVGVWMLQECAGKRVQGFPAVAGKASAAPKGRASLLKAVIAPQLPPIALWVCSMVSQSSWIHMSARLCFVNGQKEVSRLCVCARDKPLASRPVPWLTSICFSEEAYSWTGTQ